MSCLVAVLQPSAAVCQQHNLLQQRIIPPCPTALCTLPWWLQVSAGQVKPEQVDVFLKMGGALDIADVRKKPREWVPGAHGRVGGGRCGQRLARRSAGGGVAFAGSTLLLAAQAGDV